MDEPIQTQETTKEVSPHRISNKVLIGAISVASVLVLAVGAYAYKNYSSGNKEVAVSSPVASPVASLEIKSPVADRIVDEGVTWQEPQKIDDQGLFEKSGSNSDYMSTDYYKVGTTASGGEIVLAKVNIAGMGDTYSIQRIIKNGETYKRISQNSEAIDGNSFAPTSKLEQDSSYSFKSLFADKVITKDDTELISSQSSKFAIELSPDSETKKIASTKWGDMFLEKTNSYSINDLNQANSDKTPIVRISRYYVKLNDSTQVTYEPRPTFLRDDNTFDLDFKVKGASSIKYEKFETGGCGLGFGFFPLMVDSNSLSDKFVIASKNGSELSGINATSNKTLEYAYELYKSDQAENKKDVSTFANEYAFVYWVDAYGSTIGFLNSEFKPAVECGKPVVYLYPTKETNFKVKVGAQVTKSDPEYLGGWEGVAKPNGQLTVGGKDYPNLFWEGKGVGMYPNIDFGRLVERENIKSEISRDLSHMGLNSQEISDFNAYWLDKMPQSKYIRLSWLANNELDKLAPLYISPKPESVIRVFLDFAGYNEAINLTHQTLPKFERKGYTAVEWGGLLRGK